MPLLRQLGRPGILTLQANNGQTAFAVLTGLNEQTATLRMGTEMHRVSLGALGLLWHGVFSTYWRPPPGFATELPDGSSSVIVAQLARQLTQLEGISALAESDSVQTWDSSLRARVRAFQKGQGLKPDGNPGPMTFMQIDRALGSHEPNLQAESP